MRSMMEKACFCFIIFVIHMWIWSLDPSDASASNRHLNIAHQQKHQIETMGIAKSTKVQKDAGSMDHDETIKNNTDTAQPDNTV